MSPRRSIRDAEQSSRIQCRDSAPADRKAATIAATIFVRLLSASKWRTHIIGSNSTLLQTLTAAADAKPAASGVRRFLWNRRRGSPPEKCLVSFQIVS
jgi:hypothetical protein